MSNEIVEMIAQIFEICVFPLLGILTTFLVKYINTKIKAISDSKDNELEKKYLNLLNETITDCVIATTQTYVESLKEKGEFGPEAQKQAFDMTLSAVLAILNDDAKKTLTEAVGDLSVYITQKIESEVNINK